MGIEKIIKGSKEFQNNKFLKYKAEFDKLVKEGQKPKALFIGCSDSRVVPTLITNAKPGELFILRNIGNFVPPFNDNEIFQATAAGIEYAVSVLEVDVIIVCGHSHCGAIASLYKEKEIEKLPYIKNWLSLGEKAKKIVDFTMGDIPHNEKLRTLEKVSTIFQAENILTYPKVKERVEQKKLEILAWYYQIESGTIEEYDSNVSKFVSLRED